MKGALAIASLAMGLASVASADQAKAPPQIAAVIEGKTLEESSLVGISGQVYEAGDGSWKRTNRGGVACRVVAAFRSGKGLWAMCSQAPLFRRETAEWSAEALNNHGNARWSQIATKPLFAIGRHLYGGKGEAWERLSSAPSNILSLLAESPKSGYAVSTKRELLSVSGKTWKILVAAPAKRVENEDLPLALFGSSKNAYLITDSGSISRVAGARRTAVTLPDKMASFSLGASCAEAGGAVLALGRSGEGDASVVSLLRLDGAAAVSAGDAPALGDGERIGILHCMGGKALLSTSRGRVLIRSEEGTWSEKKIDNTPPAEKNPGTEGSKPAHSL